MHNEQDSLRRSRRDCRICRDKISYLHVWTLRWTCNFDAGFSVIFSPGFPPWGIVEMRTELRLIFLYVFFFSIQKFFGGYQKVGIEGCQKQVSFSAVWVFQEEPNLTKAVRGRITSKPMVACFLAQPVMWRL